VHGEGKGETVASNPTVTALAPPFRSGDEMAKKERKEGGKRLKKTPTFTKRGRGKAYQKKKTALALGSSAQKNRNTGNYGQGEDYLGGRGKQSKSIRWDSLNSAMLPI